MDYGKTLLRIRQSKNMTLKEACGEALSVSQLSRFEKGKSSLRVDDFHEVLTNLNTTPAEFHYLNQTSQIYSQELTEILQLFDEYQNLDEIDFDALKKNFLKKAKPYNWEYFFYYFYSYIEKLHKEEEIDPSPILDYFMQVEDWGEMEIRLYSMFLFAFEVNTIYTLMRTAVQRSQAYQAISETKNLLYTLLINSFSVFLKEDKWAYAKEVLEMFDEEYAEKTDKIDIHAQFHFNHGLLAFRENRIEEAKKYCEEAIQMCERTKQFEMVNILKRRYKQWLKNPQLKEVFIQVGWPENRI